MYSVHRVCVHLHVHTCNIIHVNYTMYRYVSPTCICNEDIPCYYTLIVGFLLSRSEVIAGYNITLSTDVLLTTPSRQLSRAELNHISKSRPSIPPYMWMYTWMAPVFWADAGTHQGYCSRNALISSTMLWQLVQYICIHIIGAEPMLSPKAVHVLTTNYPTVCVLIGNTHANEVKVM